MPRSAEAHDAPSTMPASEGTDLDDTSTATTLIDFQSEPAHPIHAKQFSTPAMADSFATAQ